MKHLLLLLFLSACMAGRGQGCDEYKSPTRSQKHKIFLNELHELGCYPKPEELEFDISWQMLLDYQAECYKDSITEFTHIPCPDGIMGCGVNHMGTVTTHRTPTFEGFILWMKRRYE